MKIPYHSLVPKMSTREAVGYSDFLHFLVENLPGSFKIEFSIYIQGSLYYKWKEKNLKTTVWIFQFEQISHNTQKKGQIKSGNLKISVKR